ncbi:hypothetical protein ACHAWF_004575 [Thalassiosira exigua]
MSMPTSLAARILPRLPLIRSLSRLVLAGSSSMQGAPSSEQAALRLKWPSQQLNWSTLCFPCLSETSSQPWNSLLKSIPRASQYFALNPTFTARCSRTTPVRWSAHVFPSFAHAPNLSMYAGITSGTTRAQG